MDTRFELTRELTTGHGRIYRLVRIGTIGVYMRDRSNMMKRGQRTGNTWKKAEDREDAGVMRVE